MIYLLNSTERLEVNMTGLPAGRTYSFVMPTIMGSCGGFETIPHEHQRGPRTHKMGHFLE